MCVLVSSAVAKKSLKVLPIFPTIDAGAASAYIVGMSQASALGEFEVVVLMAVLHLQGDVAFGSAILREIKHRSGRDAARGSVYITLDRLEDKGLLASKLASGTAARGGKPKRVFKLTARGTEQLKHSVALLSRMHKGLEPILGDL